MKIFVLAVFAFVMYFIITGRLNRTIAAMAGGLLLLIANVFSSPYEGLRQTVDVNTLLFLIGMMIFVRVMEKSGIFQYIAIRTVKVAGTKPVSLLFTLTFIVVLVSSFMDNVTTVLIFIPITIAITDILQINPTPFIVSEIFASNIGGTMTPIGDPPNILITSAAKIPFLEFTLYMVPINLIILFFVDLAIILISGKDLRKEIPEEFIENFDESKAIDDKLRFVTSIIFMIVVLVLFLLQKQLNLESSIIGLMAGFFSLLIFERKEIELFLSKVEWEVIFFFLGIFIITGAMEQVGIMSDIAKFLIDISKGSRIMFSSMLVWISGILSGFIGNIPFAATMIPAIKQLPQINPAVFSNIQPFWYALSLGVCLGGNLTPVGALANVVGLSLLKKHKGTEISFKEFIKYGFVAVAISLVLSNIYMLLLLEIMK
ncbi:MAG TPA: ArsB/NhaD family transporter [Fervidobacterium sp.]|nr:citrate transporter [Fervidobacterium sp.]HOK87466.1 ArsB/NhaD family transporter [Fervidobacterium sp.]HOM73679.1 ArsB/NhaD family transporter [Fervidobacterium sp.]HRD20703.1 ArsB/NhaD family transporter [Fervidobacterium sp.]